MFVWTISSLVFNFFRDGELIWYPFYVGLSSHFQVLLSLKQGEVPGQKRARKKEGEKKTANHFSHFEMTRVRKSVFKGSFFLDLPQRSLLDVPVLEGEIGGVARGRKEGRNVDKLGVTALCSALPTFILDFFTHPFTGPFAYPYHLPSISYIFFYFSL